MRSRLMQWTTRTIGAVAVTALVTAGLAVSATPSQGAPPPSVVKARRAGLPVLSGSGVAGTPLSVLVDGLATLLPVQWLRDGTPIAGATGGTYVPDLADVGHQISALVTLPLLGGVETLPMTILAPAGGVPDLLTPPQLTGTPVVGELLTVLAPVFSLPGVATAYQWLSDGVPIPGQTGDTYTPGIADVGHEISVRVTSTLAGLPVLSTVTNILPISAAGGQTLSATAAPTLSGTAKVGKTLSVGGTEWNEEGVATTYQWLRDGAPINGATSASYRLVPDDLDSAISAKATGTKDGFTNGVVTSDSRTVTIGDAITWTRQPTIGGTAKVGRLLTADPGAWGTGGAPLFSYQWKRDGSAISGAVAQTYQVDAADVGRSLTVTITAARSGYEPGTFTTSKVAIAKAASALRASLAKKAVSRTQRAVLTVVLKVAGVSSPTGVVKVLDGKRSIAKVKLVPGRSGKATVKLPRLKAGAHRLSAVYAGTSTIAGAASKVLTLTVRK